MGQKVHPRAFRLNTNKTWDSRWFAEKKDFPYYLKQDTTIRKFILGKLKDAGVARVDIERAANAITINVHAAKPGLVIGRGGQGVEELKKQVHNKFLKDSFSRKKGIKSVNLNILEIEKIGLEAALIMQGVVIDLEKRIPFRRAVKQAISRV
ncbi:30S ribosomal protein S3, partial [Candidatus Falkowbacteria bacterium]|nr:30S ribosomal protein S3 [Candidatus Falkowbacteria bacterium]